MVPRENKNNAYAKFGGTNKEYYSIFYIYFFFLVGGLYIFPNRIIPLNRVEPEEH